MSHFVQKICEIHCVKEIAIDANSLSHNTQFYKGCQDLNPILRYDVLSLSFGSPFSDVATHLQAVPYKDVQESIILD